MEGLRDGCVSRSKHGQGVILVLETCSVGGAGWPGFCALQTGLNCRSLLKGYSLRCNVT